MDRYPQSELGKKEKK